MDNKYTPKRQHHTSIYNNRKIKPSQTGYATIRKTIDNKYIIIAHFENWIKSHSINLHDGKPESDGKEYKTFKEAQNALKKYGLNMLRRPHLKAPLAVLDSHNGKIHPSESRITWK